MIDYFSPLHFVGSLTGSIILTEALYRRGIIGNSTKAAVYGSALVFGLGLIKEVNDFYQIIKISGNPDFLDVLVNALGAATGFIIEDYRFNSRNAGRKIFDGIEKIVNTTYHKTKSQ